MRPVLATLTILALAAAAVPALALDIGEKAPELDLTQWYGGEPVVLEQCVGKKVVLLEFWSTFCDPCKRAIPRISRLAAKHAGADLEIVTISDEKADVIKDFLKDGKIKYRVACDEARNTWVPYLHGVPNQKHAPVAYILDKTGNIAWRGNPSPELDRALSLILAGKLDAVKAKEIAELQTTVDESYEHKEWAQAAADADKLLAADPGNERGLQAKLKGFETEKAPEKSRAFFEKHLPLIDDDSPALNLVAWELATSEQFAARLPDIALKAARRAVELSEGLDAAILDTLARAEHEIGMLDEAIEAQSKAVAIEETEEKLRDVMKATLAYYKACAEARKGAGK